MVRVEFIDGNGGGAEVLEVARGTGIGPGLEAGRVELGADRRGRRGDAPITRVRELRQGERHAQPRDKQAASSQSPGSRLHVFLVPLSVDPAERAGPLGRRGLSGSLSIVRATPNST